VRTRNSLTVVLSVLITLLVGAIVTLVTCSGPNANAGGPDPAPPPTATGSGGPAPGSPPTAGARGGPARESAKPKVTPEPDRTTAKPPLKPPSKPPVTVRGTAPRPVLPRLGDATVPRGAAYDVSDDGLVFTMTFSTLAAGTAPGPRSRSLSTTVPVTGDTGAAAIVLVASGFALTDAGTTAKLTITANGRISTRIFRAGTDDSYVQRFPVALRGAHECRITLAVEVIPGPGVREPDGVLDVLSLDAALGPAS